MADRGGQQLETGGGKKDVGGSSFWGRRLRDLQLVLLNRWFQFLIIMLAVAAHTWLPGWWVRHFPEITLPIELSYDDESRITDYFLQKCPGAECEKSQHNELRQMADDLVKKVRDDVFYGEHPDVANEMKDEYKDRYVTYIVYRFFDLSVRSCFEPLQASLEAVDRRPGTSISEALADLAQTKPNCAYLKIPSNETLRSDIIEAYATSFSRVREELGFRLAAEIFHNSLDALDRLQTWVSTLPVSTLPNEGTSEQEITKARSDIHIAGQLIDLQMGLREFIETTMYREQREEQKQHLEHYTLYVLLFLILSFSPVLPEICKQIIHLSAAAMPHNPHDLQ